MDQHKKDLIDKWRVTCALRGITVFDESDDDYEVAEYLETLQTLADARDSRDVHLACADDLFKLGLNHNDYMIYDEQLEDEREAAAQEARRQAEADNEIVQSMTYDYKYRRTSGPSQHQRYCEFEVPTDTQGTLQVKVRIVNISFFGLRIWQDYTLPNKVKVHESDESRWSWERAAMNKKLPAHWQGDRAERDHVEISIVYNMIRKIQNQYRAPAVKKTTKPKGKAVV